MIETQTDKSWREIINSFKKPSVITMLFLGFSAGIPILLIFSSLSLWLREAGVSRSAVTFFSWAALGYSFKFVWAPLVDQLPLPFLTKIFGRRRSWILLAQTMIIVAISGMALTDPASGQSGMVMMAVFACLLGFSSATQDIVIDAFRIESDDIEMQALLSSTYMAGYRIAMLIAGAGTLKLAIALGSTKEVYSHSAWMWSYLIMAGTMIVGIVTVLIVKEPQVAVKKREYATTDYARFCLFFALCAATFIGVFYYSKDFVSEIKATVSSSVGKSLGGFLVESTRMISAIAVAIIFAKFISKTPLVNKEMVDSSYVNPVKDFFKRYGNSVALLLLCLIGMYRISDIVLGVISNVFYQDMDFNKDQIANAVKTFGVLMVIVGSFFGGAMTLKFGVMRMMMIGAILSAATNLLFLAFSYVGNNIGMLYFVIAADNLAAGVATAAFIAFLSGLVNVSFTAMQYAIFSSLMTLFPKVLGGYSGSIVDSVGYPTFFIFTTLIGVPVLYLVWLAGKKLDVQDPPPKKTSATPESDQPESNRPENSPARNADTRISRPESSPDSPSEEPKDNDSISY